MDGVVYRRATLADKDGVLAINKHMFGGRDYLPSMYEHLLGNPNCTCYLAELAGEIIGFSVGHLVDGGQTVVTRAGRVKEGFTGQGIYKVLYETCVREFRISRHAFMASYMGISSRKSIMDQYENVLTKNIITLVVEKENIQPSQMPLLQQASSEDLRRLMVSETARTVLFPRDRIIVFFVPFKPITSNITELLSIAENIVMFCDVKESNSFTSGLLTIWTSFLKGNTLISLVDIYGRESAAFARHFASFIAYVQSMQWKDMSLELFFGSKIDGSVLREMVSNCNINATVVNSYNAAGNLYNQVTLFEKMF